MAKIKTTSQRQANERRDAKKSQDRALGAAANTLADDLGRGHYSMSEAVSMLRRCAVALKNRK